MLSLGLRLPSPCAAQPQPQSLNLELASSALLDLHKKSSFFAKCCKNTLLFIWLIPLFAFIHRREYESRSQTSSTMTQKLQNKESTSFTFLNTLFWDLWDLLQTRISSQTNKICSKARLCQLWGSQFQCWDPWSYLIWFFWWENPLLDWYNHKTYKCFPVKITKN